MYEELFPNRLSQLRNQKNVSARDMSLSIGQNPGYINNIETGKALPSMASFFFICEYLNITPYDFFDFDKLYTIFFFLEKLRDKKLIYVVRLVFYVM